VRLPAPFVRSLPSIHIQQIKAVITSAAHTRCSTLIAHQAPQPPQLAPSSVTDTAATAAPLYNICCAVAAAAASHTADISTQARHIHPCACVSVNCSIDCTTRRTLLVLLLLHMLKAAFTAAVAAAAAIAAAVVAAAAALRLVHVGDLSRLERCPAQTLVVASDSEGYEQHCD
jgi:hypothetical protein